MCVCVLDREGNRVFAIRALAVVETTVYLTGNSDCLPVCVNHFHHLINVTLV